MHRGSKLQSLAKATATLAATAAENRIAMQAVAQNQTGGSAPINPAIQQPSHTVSDAPPSYTHEMGKQYVHNRTQEAQQRMDDVRGGLENIQQRAKDLTALAQTTNFKKSSTKKENGFFTRALEGLRSIGSWFSRNFSFLGKLFPWSWK